MKKGFFENIFLNFKKINNNNFLNIDMLKFFVNKSLSNKEKENVQQHDYTEMKAFYYMVLKMKKKRPRAVLSFPIQQKRSRRKGRSSRSGSSA